MQGIDLFDTAYLLDVTNGGYALAFPLSPAADEAEQQQQQQRQGQQGSAAAAASAGAAAVGTAGEPAVDECGRDDSKLNLWALAYRTDRRPLLPGCTCFACANHTRAYLHHLLQTHEMTAQVGARMAWELLSTLVCLCACVLLGCPSLPVCPPPHTPPPAQVLLEVHNTHHYLRFFAEIRKAIAAGRFAAFRDWFLQRRQRWLVGQGGGQ